MSTQIEALDLGSAFKAAGLNKRKETTNKDLVYTEEMLKNIFEGKTTPLLVEMEEADPLKNEDYECYYRIKDMTDNGRFPREELLSFYTDYKGMELLERVALMNRW